MEKERIEELKERPFAKIYPQAIKDIEKSVCPSCGNPCGKVFDDYASIKEYRISGFCQACQDRVFGKK